MIRGLALVLALLASGLDFPPYQPPAASRMRTEICPGATHFYNHRTMHKPPYWARDMRVVCRIGAHTFLAPKAHHHRGRVAAKD